MAEGFSKDKPTFFEEPPKQIDQVMEEGFTKDELIFMKLPPEEIEIECPICLQVMLNDPHLVSCCGHHFCGSCIKRVKDSNGACPYCKETEFQVMPDKGHLRIINGLKVNCTNKGCEWKGELKDLSVHLNKGKREGQCQYEEVTCVHSGCEIKKQRQYLVKHEKDECLQRPYECQHCQCRGTYQFITNEHYPECAQYPVPCPNKCGLQAIPRCNVQTHVTEECPLQSVECEFKWAGCQYTPLRKDLQQHNNDSQLKHMSLLAKECRELKKENEELRREIQNLQQELIQIHTDHDDTKAMALNDNTSTLPKLPARVPLDGKEFHFYSAHGGHHMSVSVKHTFWGRDVIFTVYKGKIELPKVRKVVVKGDLNTVTLTVGRSYYMVPFREYPDDVKGDIVQKFSFRIVFFHLEIICVY